VRGAALAPGDEIVISGVRFLSDGMKVRRMQTSNPDLPAMNIAEASIRNKTLTLVFAVLMVVLGIWSYIHLPRLEDPEFTIKDALIITPYPGASAEEVEKEVSDVIELAAQQLEQLERVVSRSERGRSTVTVTIRDQYDAESMPQVWN
jgi:multidrug efflux pump subunit AcrB